MARIEYAYFIGVGRIVQDGIGTAVVSIAEIQGFRIDKQSPSACARRFSKVSAESGEKCVCICWP